MGTLGDAGSALYPSLRELVQSRRGLTVVTEEADVPRSESIDGEEKDVVHHALLVT